MSISHLHISNQQQIQERSTTDSGHARRNIIDSDIVRSFFSGRSLRNANGPVLGNPLDVSPPKGGGKIAGTKLAGAVSHCC